MHTIAIYAPIWYRELTKISLLITNLKIETGFRYTSLFSPSDCSQLDPSKFHTGSSSTDFIGPSIVFVLPLNVIFMVKICGLIDFNKRKPPTRLNESFGQSIT